MATITSAGSGLWSAGATWAGGNAPADNDAVVIASGHTVTFDVDQSGFANGIAGITVTGTLKLSRSSGAYYLKLKASNAIAGAGTFDCGTSGDVIPFAAKHTITGGANWHINGSSGLTLSVYGTEPTYKYVKLSAQEASGQTALSVDTDVTGDIWAVGDSVTVVGGNNNSGNYGSSDHTITDISSAEITVTGAIGAIRVAGSYIVLTSRNVSFVMGASTTNSFVFYRIQSGKLSIGGGLFSTVPKAKTFYNNGPEQSGNVVITGGVFTCNYFAGYMTDSTISGIVSICVRFFSNYSRRNVVSNSLFLAGTDAQIVDVENIFDNCTFAFLSSVNAGVGYYNNCLITNTAAGVGNVSGGGVFTNCTFRYNQRDTYLAPFKAYNCKINTITAYSDSLAFGVLNAVDSFDHDQVAGDYKRWMIAGTVVNQSSVLPSGYSTGFLYSLAGNYYFHHPINITVPAGASVSIEVQLRKTVSMAYLPRAYLMNSIDNPIAFPSLALDSFTMTNSTDTWESDTFTIDNSAGTYRKDYTLWFVAKNASGSIYSAYKITTAGGGGGLLTNPGMSGGMRG